MDYYGLASVFVDVDDDGWLDLVVANDSVPNYLYRNQHDGTFEDISYASGFALSEDGREQASMGIARRRLQSRRQSGSRSPPLFPTITRRCTEMMGTEALRT